MFMSHRTTRIALCCCAAVLAGCAKKDEAAVDTTAMTSSSTTATAPVAPTPINLADVAGKWDVRAVPTSGDTTPTTYVLTAMGTPDGWTLTFPGRKATVPVRVTTDADSIIVAAGPYASVRRKGVQVSTNGSLHLQNGDLVGVTTAHYNVKTADSVLTLNVAGTRTK
jgi:hypothetical protein